MANRRLRKEYAETQSMVKDAATSLRKAADRAAKVARVTGGKIGRSKEVRDARKQGAEALRAIAAAAKVVFESAAAGAKTLRSSKEVKKAGTKTRQAARSTAKTTRSATRTATKAAGSTARSSVKSARRRVTGGRTGR